MGNFIFLETREEIIEEEATRKRVTKETLVFPRYHQPDAVKKLMRSASQEGAGYNYLIQHSAGSGKTNSISWLSHRRQDHRVFWQNGAEWKARGIPYLFHETGYGRRLYPGCLAKVHHL